VRALLADRLSLCLLLTADCSLLAAHCSLLTARLSPLAAHCNCIYCCICCCTCCVPRTTPPRSYYNLAHSSSESRLSLEPALNRPPSGPIKSMINESIPERKCVIPSCRRCHHCHCDYPSIYHLTIHLLIHLFIHLLIHLFIHLAIDLLNHLSLSICLICLPFFLPIGLYLVYLPIYLLVYQTRHARH